MFGRWLPGSLAVVSRKICVKLRWCRDLQACASPTHLPKVLITFCLWEGWDGNEGRQGGKGRGSGVEEMEKVGGSRMRVEGVSISLSLPLSLPSSSSSCTPTLTHTITFIISYSLRSTISLAPLRFAFSTAPSPFCLQFIHIFLLSPLAQPFFSPEATHHRRPRRPSTPGPSTRCPGRSRGASTCPEDKLLIDSLGYASSTENAKHASNHRGVPLARKRCTVRERILTIARDRSSFKRLDWSINLSRLEKFDWNSTLTSTLNETGTDIDAPVRYVIFVRINWHRLNN